MPPIRITKVYQASPPDEGSDVPTIAADCPARFFAKPGRTASHYAYTSNKIEHTLRSERSQCGAAPTSEIFPALIRPRLTNCPIPLPESTAAEENPLEGGL